jgi:hypothetical protein
MPVQTHEKASGLNQRFRPVRLQLGKALPKAHCSTRFSGVPHASEQSQARPAIGIETQDMLDMRLRFALAAICVKSKSELDSGIVTISLKFTDRSPGAARAGPVFKPGLGAAQTAVKRRVIGLKFNQLLIEASGSPDLSFLQERARQHVLDLYRRRLEPLPSRQEADGLRQAALPEDQSGQRRQCWRMLLAQR